MENNNQLHKSEILFLYEASYNIPNGDPFTGEQRYDEETKQILVSDVRIKRFSRDYLDLKGQTIYVKSKGNNAAENNDEQQVENKTGNDDKAVKKEGSGSARRINELVKQYKKEIDAAKSKLKKNENFNEAAFVMRKCIDVRLFGGISTKEKNTLQLTGPIQFSLLNPSLNKVNLRIHQNTSKLESKETNKQGAIATTTLVPYSLIQIHGWLNPKVAEETEMNNNDLNLLFESMWYGTNGEGSSHSRSKIGQNAVLLLEIVYAETNKKVYGVDRLIKLENKEDKKDEQLRNMDDYKFNFNKLIEVAKSDKVKELRYFTEIETVENCFTIIENDKENGNVKERSKWKEKVKRMIFSSDDNKKNNELTTQ